MRVRATGLALTGLGLPVVLVLAVPQAALGSRGAALAAGGSSASVEMARPVAPSIQRYILTGVSQAVNQAANPAANPVARPGTQTAASAIAPTSAAQGTAVPSRTPDGRLAVLTPPMATRPFLLAGLTWTGVNPLLIQVRTHTGGTWTAWQTLGVQDAVPDPGTAEAARVRHSTDPLMNSGSDGFQARVYTSSGQVPAGLRIDLINPGTSPHDGEMKAMPASLLTARPDGQSASSSGASASVLHAAAAAAAASTVGAEPAIISRAQWGADESLRDPGFRYTSTVKAAFVHHTASSNSYWQISGGTEAQAAQQIRAIYAYSVESAGYADIPYNFLVDQAGRIYEGRAGGVSLPVLSAATGGFNTDSMSVAALGNFDIARPSSALELSIARIVGWKLGLFHVDPLATTSMTSSDSFFSRYPNGVAATIPTVSGHRTVDPTACPGRYLWALLPAIRELAHADQGTQFYNPAVSANVVDPAASRPLALTATASTGVDWFVRVTDSTGQTVRLLGGSTKAGPLAVSWDYKDTGGTTVPAGTYTVTLSGLSTLNPAASWSAPLTVGAISVPSTTPLAAVYTTTGLRTSGGRLWSTTCTTVTLTLRVCAVRIWGTAWEPFQGGYVQANLWLSNNYTNLAFVSSAWTGSVAATPGATSSGGRSYRTTCVPDAATGPRTCNSLILGTVIVPSHGTFVTAPAWLLNTITYLAAPPV
jgi:N-acetylmuramoyl-L-alanine amidase/FlgD Ig-like domain